MSHARSLFFALVLGILAASASAQTLFFADFEDGSGAAFPNASANDLGSWDIEAPGQVLAVEMDPHMKSKAAKITVEGCGTSGAFMLPGPVKFTDGVIQFEFTPGDDDSMGVIFRRTAKDKGYLVTFGTIETPVVMIAKLDDGCGAPGQCNDQTGCENGGKELKAVPHNIKFTKDNSMTAFGRIEAKGSTIRIWYMNREDVKDPRAADLGVPPLLEIKDSSHTSGTVGLWHESMSNTYFDNVLVTGPGGVVAVEPRGKLTDYWGALKSR